MVEWISHQNILTVKRCFKRIKWMIAQKSTSTSLKEKCMNIVFLLFSRVCVVSVWFGSVIHRSFYNNFHSHLLAIINAWTSFADLIKKIQQQQQQIPINVIPFLAFIHLPYLNFDTLYDFACRFLRKQLQLLSLIKSQFNAINH